MRQFVAVLCFLTCEIAGENVQEKNTTFSEEIETTTAIEITTRIAATTAATTTQESLPSSQENNDNTSSSTIEASVQLSLSDLASIGTVSNDEDVLKDIAKEKLYEILSSM